MVNETDPLFIYFFAVSEPYLRQINLHLIAVQKDRLNFRSSKLILCCLSKPMVLLEIRFEMQEMR